MSERRARLLLRGAGAGLAATLVAAAPALGQSWRSMTSARQPAGERQVRVEVEYAAGTLRVEPARGDLLYRMELRYDEGSTRPLTAYDRRAGRLRLGVEGVDGRPGRRGVREGGRATIALNPRIPTDLALEFGAGEADVRLGGMALTRLDVSTGASEARIAFDAPNRAAARVVRLSAGAADLEVTGLGNARAERIEFEGGVGETTLDFGGTWTRSAAVSVEMGMGAVRLRLPRTVGVRITKDSFLTSFDAGGLVKRGNAWYSRNWEQSRIRIDLSIDAALGSIDVDWI